MRSGMKAPGRASLWPGLGRYLRNLLDSDWLLLGGRARWGFLAPTSTLPWKVEGTRLLQAPSIPAAEARPARPQVRAGTRRRAWPDRRGFHRLLGCAPAPWWPSPLFQPHCSNPSHFQSRSRAAELTDGRGWITQQEPVLHRGSQACSHPGAPSVRSRHHALSLSDHGFAPLLRQELGAPGQGDYERGGRARARGSPVCDCIITLSKIITRASVHRPVPWTSLHLPIPATSSGGPSPEEGEVPSLAAGQWQSWDSNPQIPVNRPGGVPGWMAGGMESRRVVRPGGRRADGGVQTRSVGVLWPSLSNVVHV